MSNIVFHNSDEMSELTPVNPPAAKTLLEIHGTMSTKKARQELDRFAPSAELDKNQSLMSVLYRAPADFLEKDRTLALQTIEKYHGAYLATGALQNDPTFNQDAVKKNSAVYNIMAPEHQRDPNLAETYTKKILRDSKSHVINGHEVMLPKHQISKNLPVNMQQYGDAYLAVLKMSASGRYTEKDIMESPERKYMGMIQTMAKDNPNLQTAIDKTERAVIERNLPTIEQLMQRKSMLEPGVSPIYEETQKHFPDMKQKMDKAQQEYWLSPEQLEKVGKAAARLEYNTRHPKISRTKEDYEFAQDAEKTLKEAQKRVKDREVREASLAYLKQSSIDYIYSLASDGLISMDDAAICVGMISSIPTISKASATHSGLIYASVNDYDNIDFQTPQEAMEKRAAELKERIIDTDAKLNTAEQQIYGAKTQAQNKSWAYAHPEYDRAQTQEIQMPRGHK